MYFILKGSRHLSKKLFYVYLEKDCILKTSSNVRAHNAYSCISNHTSTYVRAHFESSKSYHKQLTRILPLVQNKNSRSNHTEAAVETLRDHVEFSIKLSNTNKYSICEISTLVHQWLNRFDSLGSVEANTITEAFNALSKVNFLDQTWKRNDQDNFKKLVLKLMTKGCKLLDLVFETGAKFNTSQVASCLNCLSKWNVLNDELWPGDVELDGRDVATADLFRSFVVRLINQGIWLLDSKNNSTDKFNSRNIADILTALSKWNLQTLPGAKEFIVEIMKQGIETAGLTSSQRHEIGDRLTSSTIVKSLHAASKWNSNDIQGTREFAIRLMRQGIQFVDRFNPQEVAYSLNALSKWDIVSSGDYQQFVVRLVKRGTSIVDKFNSQDISNCLNAVSEWEINEIEGAQQFVTRLVKRGGSMTGAFEPRAISDCLNAVSKWDTNEIQGTKEFVVQLVRSGNSTVDMFNPRAISKSLNALSKWRLDELPQSREFIVRLIAKGIRSLAGFSARDIDNSLNALSKWNVNEFEGAEKFISRLTNRSRNLNCDRI